MSEFTVGDRIKYVGKCTRYHSEKDMGRRGTVIADDGDGTVTIRFDHEDHNNVVFRANVELDKPVPYSPTFSEWATNHRTAALIKRCVNAERKYQELGLDYKLLRQQEIEMRLRAARQITELEQKIRENEDFIRLQGERLSKAREHVNRVRRACDLTDGGASLDP